MMSSGKANSDCCHPRLTKSPSLARLFSSPSSQIRCPSIQHEKTLHKARLLMLPLHMIRMKHVPSRPCQFDWYNGTIFRFRNETFGMSTVLCPLFINPASLSANTIQYYALICIGLLGASNRLGTRFQSFWQSVPTIKLDTFRPFCFSILFQQLQFTIFKSISR